MDPIYDAQLGSANRNLATTVAGLDQQRGQLGQVYGLGVGPGGNVFDDPSNPFSRAAALATAYKQAQSGTTNRMAARGQLYSGALQNAQNENATQNARARDSMIRQFLSDVQQIDQAKLGAQNAYLDATTGAGAESVARGLANRPDPASVPGPPPAALKPKAGYQFVMASGPNAGLSYKLVARKGGGYDRLYENGKRERR